MQRVLKIVWIAIWLIALVTTLWGKMYESQHDLDLVLTWLMIGLGFPCSVLGVLIVSGVSYVWENAFHSLGSTQSVAIIISWFVFFTVGWIQWFVVIPWSIRKVRRRRV
jgi:hypothetical protein